MTSQPSIGRRQAGQATQNSRMVYFPMSFSEVAKEENIKGRISTAPQRALLTGLRIIDWQRLPGIRTGPNPGSSSLRGTWQHVYSGLSEL